MNTRTGKSNMYITAGDLMIKIAKFISNVCNFISIRLDYYVEIKQYELEKRKELPIEWFVDDDKKDYRGNPNFHGDD